MSVVGLITEYNPFHNGHLLHLQTAVETTGADAVVVVMSGNFLQRGEPALFNKWARTEMALRGGADVVIELPVAFATRSARQFAAGAVRILDATGIVSHICFGSESGDISPLQRLAAVLRNEPVQLKALVKKHLQTGVTYPVAESRALEDYCNTPGSGILKTDLELLNRPNNILGIEYVRALAEIDSTVTPTTITRVAAGYHDLEFTSTGIASATSVRKALEKAGEISDEIGGVVPVDTVKVMQEEIGCGRGPVFPDQMIPLLLYRLRTGSHDMLTDVLDISEGLEHRILRVAQKPGTYRELVETIKTKRYTWTRIQRALLYIMLGFNKEMAGLFDGSGPEYIRILGVSVKGRELVRRMKKTAKLPVISLVSPMLKTATGGVKKMITLDILATDLYTLLYPQAGQRQSGLDCKIMPVMWNN